MKKLIDIARVDRRILEILLLDRATGKNIIWKTDCYSGLGNEYMPEKQIYPDLITHDEIIQPRILKTSDVQKIRTKKNAEVYSPAWICNLMINKIDEEWFGYKNVFSEQLDKSWKINRNKIKFPSDKTWKDYLQNSVMEITCGEAPFLVSRYDCSTGTEIPTIERIGVLDRKLRVITENVDNEKDWIRASILALKSLYGYEYQGDSLVIARLNIFLAIIEAFEERWKSSIDFRFQKEIAKIISWNLFQMDGLSDSIPIGIPADRFIQPSLFDCFDDIEDKVRNENCYAKVNTWSRENEIILFKEMKEIGNLKKFDVVIGNPPYQDDNSLNTRKPPLYHLFMDEAYKIADKVELITPGRFLFEAGQTPKDWNKKMLNDEHLKVLFYESDANKIFPGPEIKGGIVVTYRDSESVFEPIETFSAYEEMNSVLHKIRRRNQRYMDSIVSSRGHYRLSEDAFKQFPSIQKQLKSGTGNMLASNTFSKLAEIFSSTKDEGSVTILGRENNKRIVKYLKREFLAQNPFLDSFNVLITEANGKGEFGEILSTPVVSSPGEATTDTFISIGQFETETEAESALKYIKSKFARSLLGLKKATQHTAKSVWVLVPVQDFTEKSDVDWSKSIPEIDQQLYRKYALSPEEISFIETNVREMK